MHPPGQAGSLGAKGLPSAGEAAWRRGRESQKGKEQTSSPGLSCPPWPLLLTCSSQTASDSGIRMSQADVAEPGLGAFPPAAPKRCPENPNTLRSLLWTPAPLFEGFREVTVSVSSLFPVLHQLGGILLEGMYSFPPWLLAQDQAHASCWRHLCGLNAPTPGGLSSKCCTRAGTTE